MIFNWFRCGKLYSVLDGEYKGCILMLITKSGDNYHLLSIPDMINHKIPKKDFDFGVKNGIIEYIERSPLYVRTVAKAQFIQNEKKGRI